MKKRTLTYYLLSFAIGSIGVISCDNNMDPLSRDKMVEVLHDIQLAEAIHQTKYDSFREKEQKDALIQGVLEKHGITQAQLDSSLVWYADNAEIYMKVNDSIISSLKQDLVAIEKKLPKGFYSQNVNNSILPTYFYLSGDKPTLTFSIDSTQASKYPEFVLEFNTLGIQAQMKSELEIVFEYVDTTIIHNQSLSGNKYFEVKGEPKPLKSVSGYFHVNAHELINNKVLLHNILLKTPEATDSITISGSVLRPVME